MTNNNIKKIYKEVHTDPVRANIVWSDIETMFIGLGAKIYEGNGSRIRVELNGERAVFHRPHPGNTADKGAVKSVRRFLKNAEVKI